MKPTSMMSKLAVVAVAMTTFLQAAALPTGLTSTTTALPFESSETIVRDKSSSMNGYGVHESQADGKSEPKLVTDTSVNTQVSTAGSEKPSGDSRSNSAAQSDPGKNGKFQPKNFDEWFWGGYVASLPHLN
ncbi:hypothetical protein F5878DRAFT_444267 [Lentinula raphanica]|uniref:Uncharacterized protein n=1 Tax=Lentinula raphanica TaxID=153919 RepID=A0AA38NY98_9AGAR|nr:hypothetical protein F5878DRAFT_444267 [Lentinula raphanica]